MISGRGVVAWLAFGAAAMILLSAVVLCVGIALATPWLHELFWERGPAVAIVRLEGVISSSGGDFFSGQGANPEIINRRLEELAEDDEIRAIVLRINTPGGGVVASDELRSAVLKVRKAGKPVVTSMGEVAASGGYYVAAATDHIVANAQTTTGSIGVIAMVPIVSGLLDRIGVDVEVVRSGPLKGAASGFAPLADNERALLQGLIDEAYEQFVGIVAEGRRMERGRVREIADGRVYSGNQALRLGLIDEIGDLPEAIERAAVLANLPPKPRVVQEHPRSLLEELLTLRAIGQPRPSTALGLTSDPIAPLQYLYLGR